MASGVLLEKWEISTSSSHLSHCQKNCHIQMYSHSASPDCHEAKFLFSVLLLERSWLSQCQEFVICPLLGCICQAIWAAFHLFTMARRALRNAISYGLYNNQWNGNNLEPLYSEKLFIALSYKSKKATHQAHQKRRKNLAAQPLTAFRTPFLPQWAWLLPPQYNSHTKTLAVSHAILWT